MLRLAIQRPIGVVMLFTALVLLGIISYTKLPVDLLPAITYPRLTVITSYEEIPAEDLERLVTQPLEEVITGLSRVRNVVSRTREGISTITVDYEWGTQMDFANLHLREAIDRVAFRDDFPEDAERPLILRWDPTARPVAALTLEGNRRIESLTDFAREVLKPAVEQVDGISQAEVVGGADREIRVEPDAQKLAVYGVDMQDIREALARSNVTFPGGKIRHGPLHLSLRIKGEYETLDEIAATDILRPGLSPVRVSDVAQVFDTTKELEGMMLLGGKLVVSVLLYKEPEANTIAVSKEVDAALENLQKDYPEFKYSFVYRDADYVTASFRGLVSSLLVGAALAFVVLFLFLREFRSPLLVGAAIPISLIISFVCLYFGDVKLNLMSVGGLSLALGMLLDNSIVVNENINRHLQALDPTAPALRIRSADAHAGTSAGVANNAILPQPADDAISWRRRVAAAVERGTTEMARPVSAGTLTTIAVFFPVVYVPGVAGAFFRDQALTVTFALAVSIVSALLLQPVLAAHVLQRQALQPRGLLRFLSGLLRPIQALFKISGIWLDFLYRAYHAGLERTLRHRGVFLLATVLGILTIGWYATRIERRFMPARSSGDLRLDLELPAGTPLEQTSAFVADLAGEIESDPAVRAVFSQVGRTERTLAALADYRAANTARIRIMMKPKRGAFREGIRLQNVLGKRLARSAQVNFTFRDEGIGLGEVLSIGEAPFTMGVIAEEARTAVQAAAQLSEQLVPIAGLENLQMDRVLDSPNVVLKLDREEILRSGLDPNNIARELRNRIAGSAATTFNETEQRIDIAVRLAEDVRRDLQTALSTPVLVGDDQTVALGNFVDLEEQRPVRELVRRNQRRMVTITGNIEGRPHRDVWRDAQAVAAALDVPSDVSFVTGGERDAMRRSFVDLGWAMLLALALVYMILAAQFESFRDPLIIAAIVPVGLAGSALAIGVSGNSINVMSMLGVLPLLGIAVNDAILKVDTIRSLRSQGMSGRDATLEASRLRFRPILMTNIVSLLALAPMAIGLGSGEQLQRPLAITIIGGLTFTTLLTSFFTPILYEIAHGIVPAPRQLQAELRYRPTLEEA